MAQKLSDWNCSLCGDHQFAGNPRCRSCGSSQLGDEPGNADVDADASALASVDQYANAQAATLHSQAVNLPELKARLQRLGYDLDKLRGQGYSVQEIDMMATNSETQLAQMQQAALLVAQQQQPQQKPTLSVIPSAGSAAAQQKKQDRQLPVIVKLGDWQCPMCKELNNQRHVGCKRCGNEQRKHTVEPGDWLCPRCGDLQFKRNPVCRKCRCSRPTMKMQAQAAAAAAAAERAAKEGTQQLVRQETAPASLASTASLRRVRGSGDNEDYGQAAFAEWESAGGADAMVAQTLVGHLQQLRAHQSSHLLYGGLGGAESSAYGGQAFGGAGGCYGAGLMGGCTSSSGGDGVSRSRSPARGSGPCSGGRGPLSAGPGILSAGSGALSAGPGILAAGRGALSAGPGILSSGRGGGCWPDG